MSAIGPPERHERGAHDKNSDVDSRPFHVVKRMYVVISAIPDVSPLQSAVCNTQYRI